jgi:threonine/homoserine/homoserine lactone efflux protein
MNTHTTGIAPKPRSAAARIAVLAMITGISGAVMPGPMLVLVIGQTTVRGWDAFFWVVTGHALLELVFVTLLILGLRAVLARTGVRAAIGLIGGAALLYMGGDMMAHARSLTLDLTAQGSAAYSGPKLMLAGAAVCVANPYFVGWWATIGMGQLAQLAPRTPREYICFYLGHEVADYGWYALVALILTTGRRWLTDGMYQALVLLCGLTLSVLAVWFIVSGIRLLVGRPKKT